MTSGFTSVLVMFRVYIVILACFPSTLGDSDIDKTHSSVLANIHITAASDTLSLSRLSLHLSNNIGHTTSNGCYLALHTETWKYRVLVSHRTEHKVPS